LETRAHFALIGLFVLAIIFAGFGFVWWLTMGANTTQLTSVRLIFTGSVSGLSRGSVVRFNGLRVGEVTELSLVPNDPSRVSAEIEIDPLTPLKTDTRARLEYSGLTGVATVQLTGGSNAAPGLQTPDGEGVPTIFADRSDFQDILETVQRIAARTDTVLTKAEKILDTNEASITDTLRNVETFSDALASNADGVAAFLNSVGQTGERISSLSVQLERLAVDADTVVRAIDPASINRSLGNVEKITETVAQNRESIGQFMTDAAATAKRLNDTSASIATAVEDIRSVTALFSAERVGSLLGDAQSFFSTLAASGKDFTTTLANASALSESLRGMSGGFGRIVENTDVFSKALADNREQLTSLMRDGSALVSSLNASTLKLDQALTDFSKLASSLDVDKLNASVTDVNRFTSALGANSDRVNQAMKDIGELTAKLNAAANRVDGVLAAAEGFLGKDGENGAGVMADLKATMAEISETARAFQTTARSVTGITDDVGRLVNNLDKRTAQITSGFNKLTGPALRDIQALSAETRRAVGEINRTAGSLRRNPSQLIFGGQNSVPEYQGSR
jgi:phospholipid/cholesterol/gamma-HCH transport system substrate-binding protein